MTQRIAIVGTGLSGALLADELSKRFDVTAFERGKVVPTLPPKPRITGHPLGLYPSYAYGLGGTTNFWQGGLIAMTPGEYSMHWPAAVHPSLEAHVPDVVRRLYGDETARFWAGQAAPADAEDLFMDRLMRPRAPFRAAHSTCFSRAHLLFDSQVLQVVETENGVSVTTKSNGILRTDHFDLVIVAAGGLNSPLILARSGLGGSAVGQNITDHPMGFVAKITKTQANRFAQMALQTTGHQQHEPMLKVRDPGTGLWTAFYLRPTSTPGIHSDPYADSFKLTAPGARLFEKLKAVISNPDLRAQALNQFFGWPVSGDHAYVLAVAEQEAFGQGHVTEDASGSPSLFWKVSDAVVTSITNSMSRLERWVGGTLRVAEGDMKARLWTAAHHSGGCRMSADPAKGVVDTDLLVHGCSKVFVCDGSVIPSTGASNTGLTIGALALRLAAHLSDVQRRNEEPTMSSVPSLLVTGTSSHVAQMVLPHLARKGHRHLSVDLRQAIPSGEVVGGKLLLHLANDSVSTQRNATLQESTAAVMARRGLDHIVVPLSFASLQRAGAGAGLARVNCGFEVEYSDAYISGKLEAEAFWTEWQQRAAHRRTVTFVYIPTILGPHSNWTRMIAASRVGTPIYVPDVARFFYLTEAYLAQAIAALCDSDPSPGVHRHVVYEKCTSFAAAIAWDRGVEFTRELPVHDVGWRVLASSRRHRIAAKVFDRAFNIGNKVAFRLSGKSLLPVGPIYYALFRLQELSASEIERLAD